MMNRFIMVLTAMIFFTSSVSAMTLREAVDTALKNNPSLQQTQKSIAAAEEDVKIAKGQKGVSVSLNGSFDANKSEGASASESLSTRVTGSLPLYTGKRLESEIKSAELYVQIAQLEYAQARDDLIYQVVTAYVDALENKATVLVNLETRDNLAEHEQNISDLYEAGAKAKIDLLRASVETSNANQDVSRAKAAYEVSLTELATLMSLDSIADFDVEDLNTSTDMADLESCLNIADRVRSDLQADALRIERAEHQVTSAKSGWLPDVTASAGTGFSARSSKWDPTSDATAGVSATWSIFDNKITRARVDEAQIEVERLRLSMQSDIENVHKDVISAYKNLQSALVRLETTKRAVELAEEERFIATERYRAGEGILLDILDAEVALSTARKNHISARYDVIRYRFALAHAMGKTL